ncbi:MAG TPA: hypothetical protein VMU05_15080 [Dongiaceae bacterium]|nr:hypothetical protein [Dongiaceae bacterium]
MKLRSIAILSCVLIVGVSMAMAWPKSKKTVNFYEPTLVGSVTLQPGEYVLDWTGTGTEVQVSFSQRDKTFATVPATLEATQNREDSIITAEAQPGARSLVEIELKNSTLRFTPQTTNSGN